MMAIFAMIRLKTFDMASTNLLPRNSMILLPRIAGSRMLLAMTILVVI